LPYPKGKLSTDYLLASFFIDHVYYRIRFKVFQGWRTIPRISFVWVGDRVQVWKRARHNVIHVDYYVSATEFFNTVKEELAKRYKISNNSISLKFEKGNIIKLREKPNV